MPDATLAPAVAPGFVPSPRAVAAPVLSQTPGVALEQWSASCADASCGSTFVAACVRAGASTTSPEVDDLVHQKLVEVAASTVARSGHEGTLAWVGASDGGAVTTRDLEGDGLAARTWTAFSGDGATLHACFALCAGPAGAKPVCGENVHLTHIVGDLGARPAPSLPLRAALTAVHHPRAAVGAMLGVAAALAWAAIATRPRGARTSRARRGSAP